MMAIPGNQTQHRIPSQTRNKPILDDGRKLENFSKLVFNLFQPIPKTLGVLGKLHFRFCVLTVFSILKYSLGNQLQKCFKESVCLLSTAKHMDSCC